MKTKGLWIINKILGIVQIICISFSFLGFLFYSVPVHAQAVGFSECQFIQDANQEVSVQNCLTQIFQFTFVLSIFIIAIRVAIAALDNYNPLSNGKAQGESIRLIWEVTLGLLLIGGPTIIINTINPAALNLSFINVGTFFTGGVPQNSGPTPGGATQTNRSSASTNRGNLTAGGTDEARETVEGTPQRTTSSTPTTFLINPFYRIPVFSQEDPEELRRAEQYLTNLFELENDCTLPFVDRTTFEDCRIIETQEFIEARNRISPLTRQTLTPLNETKKVFQGEHVARVTMIIKDVRIRPTASPTPSCFDNYAVLEEVSSTKRWYITVQTCDTDETPIWSLQSEEFSAKVNTEIGAGEPINLTNSTIRLLSQ